MKNRKLKKSVIIILILTLVIAITSLILFILHDKKEIEEPSKYSEKAVTTMKKNNIYNKIKDLEYSKTLEVLLENNTYQDQYLEDYIQIEYQSNINHFDTLINQLLEKNYTSKEINHIFSNYSKSLDIILDMEHIDILAYKDISNFKIDRLERYLAYQKDNDYDLETIVTYVNIGLDLPGYSEFISYTTDMVKDDLTILVNKYHKLPDDYVPEDLTPLSDTGYYLRKEAAKAYEELKSAALLDNVYFSAFSTYRSFDLQKRLYENYKRQDGEKVADTYSARPGFSEHQLGLAVDIRSNVLIDNLTPHDYEWMLNHSYQYGFIVRYPKGKQHITQYMEEPWHLRYLGIELATKVHASGLTYDEYYDLYMEK